jgi:hypothetical protein
MRFISHPPEILPVRWPSASKLFPVQLEIARRAEIAAQKTFILIIGLTQTCRNQQFCSLLYQTLSNTDLSARMSGNSIKKSRGRSGQKSFKPNEIAILSSKPIVTSKNADFLKLAGKFDFVVIFLSVFGFKLLGGVVWKQREISINDPT